jgi:hypothetical protein
MRSRNCASPNFFIAAVKDGFVVGFFRAEQGQLRSRLVGAGNLIGASIAGRGIGEICCFRTKQEGLKLLLAQHSAEL